MPETPTYFDRDEMTRPGHTPSLVSTPEGPDGRCSCGWLYEGLAMAGTVTALWHHIQQVDRERVA